MIDLRMRRIETSSGFIIDRRDLGGPRSQRGVRKISLEAFFRTDAIDGHSLLSCRDSSPNSISIPLSANRTAMSNTPRQTGTSPPRRLALSPSIYNPSI